MHSLHLPSKDFNTFRQVSWLIRSRSAFPSRSNGPVAWLQGHNPFVRIGLTVAGQLAIHTRFPFHPDRIGTPERMIKKHLRTAL